MEFAEVKIKVIPEIAEWRVKSEDTRKGALSKNTTSYFHNCLHRFPFSFISTLHSSIFTLSCKLEFILPADLSRYAQFYNRSSNGNHTGRAANPGIRDTTRFPRWCLGKRKKCLSVTIAAAAGGQEAVL